MNDNEAFVTGAIQSLLDDIDDWCGTKPHRPIPPRPWGPPLKDLLLATAVGDLALQFGHADLQEQVLAAAGELQNRARTAIAQAG